MRAYCTLAFLIVFIRETDKESKEEGGSPDTRIPYCLHKEIDKKTKEEGGSPHTRIPYCFHKEIDKESKEEGGIPDTQAFLIVFIRKTKTTKGKPNF